MANEPTDRALYWCPACSTAQGAVLWRAIVPATDTHCPLCGEQGRQVNPDMVSYPPEECL